MILVGGLMEKDHFEDLDEGGMIILMCQCWEP